MCNRKIKDYRALLIWMFLSLFILSSCLITENESPDDNSQSYSSATTKSSSSTTTNIPPINLGKPSSSSQSEQDDDEEKKEEIIAINLPEDLAPYFHEIKLGDFEGSFHGVYNAELYANTKAEFADWNDSLTFVVFFKAPGEPCIKILKDIKAYMDGGEHKKFNRHVEILGIVTATSPLGNLDAYLSESQVEIPIYRDVTWVFSDLFGTGFVPILIVFDSYGKAWRLIGYDNQLEWIDKLLTFIDEQ